MAFGKPVRGSTGGTPKYGTQGGYSQSNPLNKQSFAGGVAEALIEVFVFVLDRRAARREARHATAN